MTMTGRQEDDRNIENKIEEKIKDSPDLVKGFYYSLGNATATTKRAYMGYIMEFIEFFNKKDLIKIKPSDIDLYMNHIHYREIDGEKIENHESIRGAKLYAIKRFYEYLLRDGIIKTNPCSNIKVPRNNVDKPVVAMTAEEIKILKENIKNGVGSSRASARQEKWRSRDYAIVALGVSTGLRVTAIREINLSDIDFIFGEIVVTEKENFTRTIYIGENTKEALMDWINDRMELIKGYPDTDALFISNQRTRITTVSIGNLLKKYTYNIDKHITPHKMRSSCATNLYEMTGDIYRVQEQLGHKSIEVTKKYTKMSKEKKIESAMLLDNL